MDNQARWFADRRAQLQAELRHAEMMTRAGTPVQRIAYEQKAARILDQLNRLTVLED